MPVLVATDVRKRYGTHVALDGVSLTVPEQSLYGFLGPNGAGKTTLLRLAVGLLHRDGGDLAVLDADPWTGGLDVRGEIGFLPTEPGLPGRMSGEQALEYFSQLDGRPPVLRSAACEALMLAARDLARPVRTYSRGMRQKLAIVQAVQHDPRLMLLDEPTEGLDPLVQEGFFAFLRDRSSAGATVFFSSHVLSEVEALCDRVAIIRQGKIVDEGRVDDLRGRRPKRLTLTLSGEQRPISIAGATEIARHGSTVVLDYVGEVKNLLAALAALPILDLKIEEPRLDEVFLSYYASETDR